MPKYLKDTKVGYFKIGKGGLDGEGVYHDGRPYKVADLWANFKGTDFTAYYAAHAKWAEPVCALTITRPAFPVEIGDYVRHAGKFYEVKAIDDLTGRPHTDMKISCQYDAKRQSMFKDS